MAVAVECVGAVREVTGSCHLLRHAGRTVMLDCGLFQGDAAAERRNRAAFPVPPESIDAVVLSHAHLDHAGRLPRLVREGYGGSIVTHHATRSLCEIVLPDAARLNERAAGPQHEGQAAGDNAGCGTLFTVDDVKRCLTRFRSAGYREWVRLLPGVELRFHDAGHILGSAIVELRCGSGGDARTVVFSGDLGSRISPVMNPPARLERADLVLMESTYGDRLHRSMDATVDELTAIFESARAAQGNILIPAFTVGRTQDLLHMMATHFERWRLDRWRVFLDSPMAIEATGAYSRYRHLYGARVFVPGSDDPALPNLFACDSSDASMRLNRVGNGAIIIAGSGMCAGGRIIHHLKNNLWRPECHVVFVGYQARGTLGRAIVDGSPQVRIEGDNYAVRAHVHTVGGLSAHADQSDLGDWYGAFEGAPPVWLVHGEPAAQRALCDVLVTRFGAPAAIAAPGIPITA